MMDKARVNQMSKLKKKLYQQIKSNPKVQLTVGCAVLLILYLIIAGYNKQPSYSQDQDYPDEKPKIEGVKKAVDPRAKWTAEISKDIAKFKEEIVGVIKEQTGVNKDQIQELKKDIDLLKQEQLPYNNLPLTDESMGIRVQQPGEEHQEQKEEEPKINIPVKRSFNYAPPPKIVKKRILASMFQAVVL